MIFKKILFKINPKISNKILQLATTGKGVVHHGLQRSGTNYLNECLWFLRSPPLNSFDEERDSPRHKHCRWYKNKAAIPVFLSEQYGNHLFSDDVKTINKLCKYPPDAVHLVVKKDKAAWLASVMNWGIRCDWFENKRDAIEQIDALVADYENYYEFWEGMALDFPRSVCVVRLEKICSDFQFLTEAMLSLGLKVDQSGFSGQIDEVSMSPSNRTKTVTTDDIIKARNNRDSHSP